MTALAAKRNPTPAKPQEPEDYDFWLGAYAKGGPWPKRYGPEPGETGCNFSAEILERHGIDPAKGRELVDPAWKAKQREAAG